MTNGGNKGWKKLLPIMLLADRATVKGPIGHTPFYLLYGQEAVLPIELKIPT
jgi:hypothetical protein